LHHCGDSLRRVDVSRQVRASGRGVHAAAWRARCSPGRLLASEHDVGAMSLFRLFIVASVVMGASHTIAKERIFEPLRRRLGGKETWLGYLVSCPYCASHWVAFVVVPLTGAYFVDVVPMARPVREVIAWFLSSIFVATVAAYLRVLFYVADMAQGLLRRAEKKEDLEVQRREGKR